MTHDDAERLCALLERLSSPGTPLPAPVAAAFPWLAAAGPRQTRAQPWYHGYGYGYGYSYGYGDGYGYGYSYGYGDGYGYGYSYGYSN